MRKSSQLLKTVCLTWQSFWFFIFSSPLFVVVWYFQLKSVHYTLQFISWFILNPTFKQSELISSVRVLDANIFGGLRWAAGLNIYDYTYDPLVNNPYIYPPLFAFLGYQFNKLPYAISHLGWLGAITTSYYLFLVMGAWYIYRLSHRLWLSLSFLGVGGLSQLILGQINYGHYFLLLLPITFGIYLSKSKILTATLWGTSVGISLYGLFLAPFIFLKFGLKWTLLGLVVALIYQFPLLFNWPSALGYPGFILSLNRYFLEQPDLSFNLRTLLYHFWPPLDSLYTFLLLTLLTIVVINFANKQNKKWPEFFAFLISFWMLIDPLISDHHLPLIYLIYVIYFPRKSFFLLFPFLFLVNDFHIGLYNLDPMVSGLLLNHSLRYLGMILVFGYCFYELRECFNPKFVFKWLKATSLPLRKKLINWTQNA